jgi:hypothetical protein
MGGHGSPPRGALGRRRELAHRACSFVAIVQKSDEDGAAAGAVAAGA